MWEVSNHTPYAADGSWTRDKSGAHHWLVAVKATFDILPNGSVKLADEQAPTLLEPEFWGEPGLSSLRYDCDIVLPKPTTDIVVLGSAYAPRGRAAPKVDVSMRVANVEKHIVVHGPRAYFLTPLGGLGTTHSDPFVTHPIRYEDAFGGADLSEEDPKKQRYDGRNPVGKGVTSDARKLVQTPAHVIEYPGLSFERGPAGFGPLASHWSPRRERAGTYDEAWAKQKGPLLPDDFDLASLLSAPDDQRPGQHLHGDEPVLLTNLTPHGALRFQLPKIHLTFASVFGERVEEHRSKLGAVIIEPDAMKLMLVWNTSLPVRPRDIDYLDETIVGEKAYVT